MPQIETAGPWVRAGAWGFAYIITHSVATVVCVASDQDSDRQGAEVRPARRPFGDQRAVAAVFAICEDPMTAPSSPAPQRPSTGEASFGVSVAVVGVPSPTGPAALPAGREGRRSAGGAADLT